MYIRSWPVEIFLMHMLFATPSYSDSVALLWKLGICFSKVQIMSEDTDMLLKLLYTQ